MKESEIGPHDHAYSGKFLERIIDANGTVGEIVEFSEREAEVVEHMMEHQDLRGLNIVRIPTESPNSIKFIFSNGEISTVPLHLTSEEIQESSSFQDQIEASRRN